MEIKIKTACRTDFVAHSVDQKQKTMTRVLLVVVVEEAEFAWKLLRSTHDESTKPHAAHVRWTADEESASSELKH